jgi:hypothetical protein
MVLNEVFKNAQNFLSLLPLLNTFFSSKMNTVPKVGDIDDEDNILTTKIKLTKNEYNATIRNKLETNRLKVINRHLSSQSDLNACKIRTSMHDLKKWLGENQKVVCNIDEFFMTRQVRRFNSTLI